MYRSFAVEFGLLLPGKRNRDLVDSLIVARAGRRQRPQLPPPVSPQVLHDKERHVVRDRPHLRRGPGLELLELAPRELRRGVDADLPLGGRRVFVGLRRAISAALEFRGGRERCMLVGAEGVLADVRQLGAPTARTRRSSFRPIDGLRAVLNQSGDL